MLCDYLRRGASNMGLTLDDDVVEKLNLYHAALVEANQQFNLTRVPDDPRESAYRNYLDSLTPLAVNGLLRGDENVIDAGAGAGLPGIPLAIAAKGLSVTLVDSVDKKVAFMAGVVKSLGLNARTVHSRLEDAGKKPEFREKFDVCVSRALAPMSVLMEITLPFVKVGGIVIAYKGPSALEELERAGHALDLLGGRTRGIIKAPSPGDEWEHRLVIIQKFAPTPKGYPRKAGTPAKKPL